MIRKAHRERRSRRSTGLSKAWRDVSGRPSPCTCSARISWSRGSTRDYALHELQITEPGCKGQEQNKKGCRGKTETASPPQDRIAPNERRGCRRGGAGCGWRVRQKPAGSRRRVFLVVGLGPKLVLEPLDFLTGETYVAMGVVKWFKPDKGYGFIRPEDGGQDVFVYISAVQKAGYTSLAEGVRVSYELVAGRSGKLSAEN